MSSLIPSLLKPSPKEDKKLPDSLTEHKAEVKSLGGKFLKVKPKGRGGRQRRPNNSTSIQLPPSIEVTPIASHLFRFRCTGDITSATVTVGDLIGICGVIGTVAATTVASIASSVKLKKLIVYPSLEPQSATAKNPEIEYASAYGTVADKSYNRSIPTGAATTAPIVSRPGKDTLASLWQNTGAYTTTLFTLYDIPKGTVIDVHVSYTQRNAIAGLNFTVSTAALGSFYYLYLDRSSTSNKMIPVALPNTF